MENIPHFKQAFKTLTKHQTYHVSCFEILTNLPYFGKFTAKISAVNLPLYGKFECKNKLTIPWKLSSSVSIGLILYQSSYVYLQSEYCCIVCWAKKKLPLKNVLALGGLFFVSPNTKLA